MFNNRRGQRQRTEGLAIFLLFTQMANLGFDQIPPVTLLSIAGQVCLFLQLITIKWRPTIDSVCISVLSVWYRNDWLRLILAAVYHVDEWHLYYNMISLMWKGRKLERKLGSLYFLGLLGIFTLLVSMTLVVLSSAAEYLFHDPTYITQCHVGFSGVLFALKVLVNYMEPDTIQYVMGIFPLPSKIVCWAELILIHFLVPNSSFLGHLAGILVGLWYVKGPFLKIIIDGIFSPFSGSGIYGQGRRNNFTGGGETGYYPNNPGSSFPANPNVDDIRSRRLARLGQS